MQNVNCSFEQIHEDVVNKVKESLPPNEKLDKMADFFKALGNSTRVKILQSLLENEMCVCDISFLLDMSNSAISHQLKTLKEAKLVKSRRDGKVVYYSLDDNHVKVLLIQALEHVKEY